MLRREDLKAGLIVKHFKRELYDCNDKRYLYEILGLAQHTETNETLVIYRAMYDDCRIYARPISMFLSEVDKNKYPDSKQEGRFEIYN